MFIMFVHSKNCLIVDGKKFDATCNVRNEINGKRKKNQIVRTFPVEQGKKRAAYMPRKFPTGIWQIKQPEFTNDLDYAPVKIPTTARRVVRLWEELNGQYIKPIEQFQVDGFYHLHFAKTSLTTLGCIRLNSASDAESIALLISAEMADNKKVFLEVIS